MSDDESAEAVRFRDLADLLRRGERADQEAALEEIFGRVRPRVLTALRKRFSTILSEEDIEDVMAQMLYRIWRLREDYRAERSPLPVWCYLIARNFALDLVRQRAKQRAALSTLWAELRASPRVDEASPPSPALAALEEALARLPPLDRQILVASVSGKEAWAAELAPQLHLSPGNLRQRRFRALAKLREDMTGRGPRA